MSNRDTNKFVSVKRDRNLNTLKTTSTSKMPRYPSLAAVGGTFGEPGQEANIFLNRDDRIFYGHNGEQWVQLSTASGGSEDGFQATDAVGAVITDNAAAGIVTSSYDDVAAGRNAQATEASAIAIGVNTVASTDGSVAIGKNCESGGESGVAIGAGADAGHIRGVALGVNAATSNDNQLALPVQFDKTGGDLTGTTRYLEVNFGGTVRYIQLYDSL